MFMGETNTLLYVLSDPGPLDPRKVVPKIQHTFEQRTLKFVVTRWSLIQA